MPATLLLMSLRLDAFDADAITLIRRFIFLLPCHIDIDAFFMLTLMPFFRLVISCRHYFHAAAEALMLLFA